MRIALLTYFSVDNTGQFFQVLSTLYALQEEFSGAYIELVNIHHERRPGWMPPKSIRTVVPYLKRHISYRNARNAEIRPFLGKKVFKRPSGEELQEYLNAEKFDLVITGADTCLKVDKFWNGMLPPYWIPSKVKAQKVFLSGSAENTLLSDLNPRQLADATDIIKNLSLIFVRDSMTKELISNICPDKKDKISITPDPTFALRKSANKKNTFNELIKSKQKPICAINIPVTEVTIELVKELKKHFTVFSINRKSVAGEPCLFLGPFEWLDMFDNIDFIMTTSFHESIFALRYGVGLVGIDVTKDRTGKNGGMSKIQDLLSSVGLLNLYRSMPKKEEIPELIEMLKQSYDTVKSDRIKQYCDEAGNSYMTALRQIKESLK